MYYLNSRYYNPEIGRFINSDGLLGEFGSLATNNMYSYCANNPIMYTDPSGLYTNDLVGWIGLYHDIRNFFNPITNAYSTKGSFFIFDYSGACIFGYSTDQWRFQANSSMNSDKARFGWFGKVSIAHLEGRIGATNGDLGVWFNVIADIGVANAYLVAQIGSSGVGIGAGAKAALVSGRITEEIYIYGLVIEFGVSGYAGGIGAEALVGYIYGQFDAKIGLIAIVGIALEIRITWEPES